MTNLTIQWRQDYEQPEAFTIDTMKKPLAKPMWREFDTSDIAHMPRQHMIDLFGGRVPVIIKEDGKYITNNVQVAEQYRQRGQSVTMLSEYK